MRICLRFVRSGVDTRLQLDLTIPEDCVVLTEDLQTLINVMISSWTSSSFQSLRCFAPSSSSLASAHPKPAPHSGPSWRVPPERQRSLAALYNLASTATGWDQAAALSTSASCSSAAAEVMPTL